MNEIIFKSVDCCENCEHSTTRIPFGCRDSDEYSKIYCQKLSITTRANRKCNIFEVENPIDVNLKEEREAIERSKRKLRRGLYGVSKPW
ncbi:MAG: hypothetical protein DSY43_01850 [Gammaproteobacteria bacterium]|nr:MAG: hypothetical protein DSY43_01850 [Gammaproteobacteria bacterium]